MIVLVFGGRDYTDWVKAHRVLDEILETVRKKDLIIVQGGADGADKLAKQWAIKSGVHQAEVPALWDTYDKAAGPIRNSAMLLLRPDRAVAFPGGTGTRDMLDKVRLAIGEHNVAVID